MNFSGDIWRSIFQHLTFRELRPFLYMKATRCHILDEFRSKVFWKTMMAKTFPNHTDLTMSLLFKNTFNVFKDLWKNGAYYIKCCPPSEYDKDLLGKRRL